MVTACIISFVVGAMLMLFAMAMVAMAKDKEPQNRVHFYLVKTGFMRFELFLSYPIKCNGSMGIYWRGNHISFNIEDYGLNPDNYIDLDYDKPIEVFLNLKD